jgi:hypothetical protein
MAFQSQGNGQLVNDQEIKNNTTYDEADQNQNPIVKNPPF